MSDINLNETDMRVVIELVEKELDYLVNCNNAPSSNDLAEIAELQVVYVKLRTPELGEAAATAHMNKHYANSPENTARKAALHELAARLR
jgi:hypothetical protein